MAFDEIGTIYPVRTRNINTILRNYPIRDQDNSNLLELFTADCMHFYKKSCYFLEATLNIAGNKNISDNNANNKVTATKIA